MSLWAFSGQPPFKGPVVLTFRKLTFEDGSQRLGFFGNADVLERINRISPWVEGTKEQVDSGRGPNHRENSVTPNERQGCRMHQADPDIAHDDGVLKVADRERGYQLVHDLHHEK